MVLRTNRGSGLAAAGLAFLLLATAPSATLAQPRETAEVQARREEAGKLADQGFDLLKNKRWDEALEKFRAADNTLHSPMFVLFQARAEEGRGHLVEAQKLMQRVIDERLPDYAPESFLQAKQEAKQAMAAVSPRVPSMSVKLSGAEPATTTITIDDRPVEGAASGSLVPVNPGQHKVVATTTDGRQVDRTVSVAEGEKREVALDLGGASVNQPPPPETPSSTQGRSWLAAGLAYGIGGAALVVGAITGGVFVGRANDLKDRCPENHCSPDDEAEGKSVSTLGNVSTAFLVIGGVGIVLGTIFVFVPLEGSSDPGSGQATSSYAPELGVGPTGLQLRGTF
jgi:hypothetical protein